MATVFLSLLLALLPTLAPALHFGDPHFFSHDAAKALHHNLSALVDSGDINGAYVIGSKDGEVVLKEVIGYQQQGSHPFFRLFSMTKPVTAIVALQLIEEGKMGLDDEIATYLPELAHLSVYDGIAAWMEEEMTEFEQAPNSNRSSSKKSGSSTPKPHRQHHHRKGFFSHPATKNATIRQLLTHTAGFAYGDNIGHPVDNAYDEAMLADYYAHDEFDFLAELADIPLLTEPGTEFHYSLGFDVLGVLVSRVGGRPLDVLMKERVFEALGMKESGFSIPMDKMWRMAPMKVDEDLGTGLGGDMAGLRAMEDPPFKSGGGGLMSTAQDYLKLAHMLLNGGRSEGGVQVLGEESVRMMTMNQLLDEQLPYHLTSFPDYEGSGFGFGVMVIGEGEVSLSNPLGEVSWAGMASNSWWISPRHGTALVAMTQHLPYNNAMQDMVKPFFYAPFLAAGTETEVGKKKEKEEEEEGGKKKSLRGGKA
jgi:CubicO group peptidase (beta-lactamase class C family)